MPKWVPTCLRFGGYRLRWSKQSDATKFQADQMRHLFLPLPRFTQPVCSRAKGAPKWAASAVGTLSTSTGLDCWTELTLGANSAVYRNARRLIRQNGNQCRLRCFEP